MADRAVPVYSASLADRHARSIEAAGGRLVDLAAPPGRHPAVLLRTVGREPREAFVTALETHPDVAWVHTVAAGVDDLIDVVPEEVVLTRTPGPAGAPVADFVLAALLQQVRGFPSLVRAHDRRDWLPPFRSRRFEELTVAILGWGAIGRATSDRCRALGMEVLVVRREPDPHADPPQHHPGELEEVLDRADALVVACPLTKETTHLIGAAAMQRLGPDGILINVARGAIVDREALSDALRAGRLGAAILDVTDPEPLPAGDDLWEAPGLLVTPHLSGFAGRSTGSEVIQIFCDNLRRFRQGEPLLHRVRRDRGY